MAHGFPPQAASAVSVNHIGLPGEYFLYSLSYTSNTVSVLESQFSDKAFSLAVVSVLPKEAQR
jgi:hypothetical protein